MAVIAVDFDNTLVFGDKVLPGAKNAINLLRENGHKIIIHSCNNIGWIKKTLENNDIRYDWIWDDVGKPIADLYVDDKGFKFMSWDDDVKLILDLMKPMDNRKGSFYEKTKR